MADSSQPATPALLASKTSAAAHQYALKNYAEAADLYSQASTMQDEVNGEMASENAELLYAYGRCLYKVAVEKSDVLGTKVAGTNGGGAAAECRQTRGMKRKAHEEDGDGGEKLKAGKDEAADADKDSKPYFQIEGDDEDWDDEDDEDAEGGGPEEEEEDDLAIAYEVLDTARILFERQLEAPEEGRDSTTAYQSNGKKSKGKAKASTSNSITTTTTSASSEPLSPAKRHILDLLSDNYDLQSEINLENEQFPSAASDATASLKLKLQIYPFDSSIVAEAYLKLSLALEFSAKTTTEKADELTGEMKKEIEGVDEDLLKDSAKHMEKAIESTKLRIAREEQEAEACNDEDEKRKKNKNIAEVKEILADMEERLKELNGTPSTLSISALEDPNNPPKPTDGDSTIRGFMSALLGENPADARAKIAEATKTANDLTGLVRHKKKNATTEAGSTIAAAGSGAGRGKRKADGVAVMNGAGKRMKAEDADVGDDELA